MEGKRLKHALYMYLTRNGNKRTAYLKKHHIFGAIGDNCFINDRKIPLYANLIRLGNNVRVASGVDFITHDISYRVINNMKSDTPVKTREYIGCIEVGDNVFIGSHTTILPDVKIGSNVIIGACSLVNKDVPDGSVVAGVPARVIGSFDDFVAKRVAGVNYPAEFKASRETVSEPFAEWLWGDFRKRRS